MRFVLALAVLLLLANDAVAADIATCQKYENEATSGAAEVRKLACLDQSGLRDDRWSPDDKKHLRWCRGHSQEEVAKERAERATLLGKCEMCRIYADLAAAALADDVTYN